MGMGRMLSDCLWSIEAKSSQLPCSGVSWFDVDFIIEKDASVEGLDVILSQKKSDGKIHLVAYASRSTSAAEWCYGITELEALAVVWAVQHFRAYLYGNNVTVITNHSAVKAVLDKPDSNGNGGSRYLVVELVMSA